MGYPVSGRGLFLPLSLNSEPYMLLTVVKRLREYFPASEFEIGLEGKPTHAN